MSRTLSAGHLGMSWTLSAGHLGVAGPRPGLAARASWWQGDGPAELLSTDSGVLARLPAWLCTRH